MYCKIESQRGNSNAHCVVFNQDRRKEFSLLVSSGDEVQKMVFWTIVGKSSTCRLPEFVSFCSDVQFADIPDGCSYGGVPRFYRASLQGLQRAVQVQLGVFLCSGMFSPS